jgi:hypothetical protein
LQQPNTPQPPAKPKRANIGFALSLVASLVILSQGILRMTRGEILESLGISRFRIFDILGLRWEITGAIGIVFSVLILIGAILIYSIGKETVGGITVLVFAALSILTGGGWLVGLILGIVGGVLGLLKK